MFEQIKRTIQKEVSRFRDSEKGDMASAAIGITIFLVIVGYVLAPVGLVAVAGVNATQAGVATGTNANVWQAIVPLSLAALIIAVVYNVKGASK